MKTKNTLLAAGLLLTLPFFAQEKPENIKPRIGGFGMKFSVLGADDIGFSPSNLIGGKTFFASFNPSKNFRIEPEFAYSKSTSPSNNGLNNLGDLTTKGMKLGGSLFGMFQRGHVNIYAGPNISVTRIVSKQEKFSYANPQYPHYEKVEVTSKAVNIGMILGAEYFFNRHFSLGTELGLVSFKYTPDISASSEYKSFFTSGNITMRAYF